MNQIISAAIVAVAIVAGGVGGHVLRSGGGGADAPGGGHEAADSGHGSESSDGHGESSDGHGSSDSYGGDDGHGSSASSGAPDYYSFGREFVVPVMRGERVESLIILNINLEADSNTVNELFSMEPKLRDSVMTTLIQLSHEGNTLSEITNVENYETIRSMVLMNLRDEVHAGLTNVLIVDVGIQDV